MEYMIAWYPTIKLLVTVLFIFGGAALMAKGHLKLGASMIIFFGWLYFMIPVRIDGTESNKALINESQYQNSKYKYFAEETEVKTTPSLTFDEEMALIDTKNEVKNNVIGSCSNYVKFNRVWVRNGAARNER